MKKMLLTAAFAALALCGCRKSVETPVVTSLTFTSESPATRTGWTGETIEWTAGDAISVSFSVSGQWNPNIYPSTPLAEGGPTAQFTVPGNFDNSAVGAYHFYAIYPAVEETDFSGAPDVFTAVPEIQTPTATSYDPKADILAGDSIEDFRSLPSYPISMMWTRLTAHADISLKNLAVAPGENVQSIVLQAQNGADLTGDVIIDLANPQEFATVGVPRVTVLADNLAFDASGNMEFWVSVFPVDLTELTVTVTTDQATYRKVFANIDKTFAQNTRNILGISMTGATRTPIASPEPEFYVKVTSAPTDWTGDYVIVYEGDKSILDSDGDARTHATATITDNKIPYASAKAYNIHIAKSGSGYSMKLGDNYYGLNSSSNALHMSPNEPTDNFRWTFRTESGGVIRAYNVKYTNRFLQFNAGSHQFRCYTSAQKDVTFFRLDGEAGGGGGGQPAAPSVTTGSASGVTQSEAVVSATYTGAPTYGGFKWGLSPDNLAEDSQADYVNNGAFSVTLDGLGPGHTYYYQAYIGVLENGTYVFYYGDVQSFTTPTGEIVIGGDQPGWYETPLMNITHSGSYMTNTSDPTQYYAIHMCSGGETGPGGKIARNYTVCYSAQYHCPLWIAAPRHSMYTGNVKRTDAYRQDPDIPASIQYNSKDTGGGCNKGHMLGSAERTKTQATNRDVFYYTNIAPQLSTGFNTGGGGWNTLEDWVDTKVCADTLYEVIGCYFDTFTDGYNYTVTPATISFGGRNDVRRPTMFYYVLLRTKSGNSRKALKDCSASEMMCAAFVRSHTNSLKGQKVTRAEMMSVADLERLTGVTYFPNVPNAPKETFSASDWGL